MPLPTYRNNLDNVIFGTTSLFGLTTAVGPFVPIPFKGRITEIAMVAASAALPATVFTLGLTIIPAAGASVAAIVAGDVTSPATLAAQTVFSVAAGGAVYVNAGDAIQFTTSGAPASTALNVNFYAVIRND